MYILNYEWLGAHRMLLVQYSDGAIRLGFRYRGSAVFWQGSRPDSEYRYAHAQLPYCREKGPPNQCNLGPLLLYTAESWVVPDAECDIEFRDVLKS